MTGEIIGQVAFSEAVYTSYASVFYVILSFWPLFVFMIIATTIYWCYDEWYWRQPENLEIRKKQEEEQERDDSDTEKIRVINTSSEKKLEEIQKTCEVIKVDTVGIGGGFLQPGYTSYTIFYKYKKNEK